MGVFASSAIFRRALLLPALVYAPVFTPAHPIAPEHDDTLDLPPIVTHFGAGDAHMLANFLAYGQGKGNQVGSHTRIKSLFEADLSLKRQIGVP